MKSIKRFLGKFNFFISLDFSRKNFKYGYIGWFRRKNKETGLIKINLFNYKLRFLIKAQFYYNRLCILEEFIRSDQYYNYKKELKEILKDKNEVKILDLGSNVGWFPLFY